MIGLVYYSDDPHKRVFRRVYPSPGEPDSVLDGPAMETNPATGKLRVMRKPDGTPHSWTSFGVDPLRPVAMDKAVNEAGRKRGHDKLPATEPVVYYINLTSVLATLTIAQQATVQSFIAAQTTWYNFIDLGNGSPATLLASVTLISPSWIVVVDDTSPVGTLLRQQSAAGHTVGVWSF